MSYKVKSIICYVAVVIFSLFYFYFGNRYTMKNYNLLNNKGVDATYPVVITEITKDEPYTYQNGMGGSKTYFKGKRLDNDEEIDITQVRDDYDPVPYRQVRKGDKILVDYDDENGWQFTEYIRTDYLIGLGILFVVALLFFGRLKGFNTLVSLAFTCLAVFAVFIPAVISGMNIYFWAIITCIYTIIMTLLIVNGPNRKTLAACIGCTGGVMIAGILTLIMTGMLSLTGIVDESSYSLTTVNPDNPIDLLAIIFAAIIIGAMGAVMDVAMSVASSLHELKMKAPKITAGEMFKSGMVIGRDMMGTMANTLVLAYIGSSLTVTVLIVIFNSSMLELFNKERIVVEVLQALVGSIGILFTIPFSCLVSSILYKRLKPADMDKEAEDDYQKELDMLDEQYEARKIARQQARLAEKLAVKEGKLEEKQRKSGTNE